MLAPLRAATRPPDRPRTDGKPACRRPLSRSRHGHTGRA